MVGSLLLIEMETRNVIYRAASAGPGGSRGGIDGPLGLLTDLRRITHRSKPMKQFPGFLLRSVDQ